MTTWVLRKLKNSKGSWDGRLLSEAVRKLRRSGTEVFHPVLGAAQRAEPLQPPLRLPELPVGRASSSECAHQVICRRLESTRSLSLSLSAIRGFACLPEHAFRSCNIGRMRSGTSSGEYQQGSGFSNLMTHFQFFQSERLIQILESYEPSN